MTNEVFDQLEPALRLFTAAFLGGVIGLEREIHGHPAGTRTHLLVALGAAIFTVLSMQGFAGQVDPTRIAAQIVSGIGFLGAGAIIRSGTSVRGLTTAASLWATASIGLAVGAADYLLGALGTVIIVFSLWPLRRLVRSIRPEAERLVRVRIEARGVEALGDVSRAIAPTRAEVTTLETREIGDGRQQLDLQIRVPADVDTAALVGSLLTLPSVAAVNAAEPPDQG